MLQLKKKINNKSLQKIKITEKLETIVIIQVIIEADQIASVTLMCPIKLL